MAKRRFSVRLDVSDVSAADWSRWSDKSIADPDVKSLGMRDERIEEWQIAARDQKSATAKARREIDRARIAGVTVATVIPRWRVELTPLRSLVVTRDGAEVPGATWDRQTLWGGRGARTRSRER